MKLLLILFIFAGQLNAATYYIDFGAANDSANGTSTSTPWKRHPYMNGFTGSYSHSAGDIFYFKLGVTWTSGCFPLTIAAGGSSGNIDTYTTTGSWGSGAQPVFDGGNLSIAGGLIQAVGKSYISFNNLNIINHGVTLTTDELSTVDLLDGHGLSITNCVFSTYSQRAMYIHWNTATTYTGFTITGNDFSHCASALWFASSVGSMTVDNLRYSQNTCHDYSSQIGGGVHSDGFIHIFGQAAFTNVVFTRNRAYGDFTRGFSASPNMVTSFFFTESTGGTQALIANNVFTPTIAVSGNYESFTTISGTNNDIKYYNNTLSNPAGFNIGSAGIYLTSGAGSGTYDIKNNICVQWQYSVWYAPTSGVTSDYNQYVSTSGQLAYDSGPSLQSYATWTAAGRDTHSLLGTIPTFVSTTDFHQTGASSGINSSTNLTSEGVDVYTDYDGNVRPAGGNWSSGAYQYGASPAGGSTLGGKITITGNATIK